MIRTTAIVFSLLSTLFASAASAGEVGYTCNYQLGSAAEATRRKIGSVVIAINVAARTARVDFGKGWFKTMSLSVDGTDVKETFPPASGAELGFFYFDLAANSGGFSGGGGNHEFFDSCVPTKIAELADKSTPAAPEPKPSVPPQGQAAPPSVPTITPDAEPKLAAKPEQSEATPSPPLSPPLVPPATTATGKGQRVERSDKDLAANTAVSQPLPSPVLKPEKKAEETLPAAPPQSLGASPPSSPRATTSDDHDASNSAKASEQQPEPLPTIETPKNTTEMPALPSPSVAASPPADARAAADPIGPVGDSTNTPTVKTESGAAAEPQKNTTEPATASPPTGASIATAEPAVAPAPAVDACVETLDTRTHAAKITFANASAILSNESVAELRKIAEIARGCTHVAIEVGGHTDNFGTTLGNRELSQLRAEAVVGILVKEGVAADKLTAVGYGQDRPIASNATIAGRRLNRRVEFHLTPAKTSG